MVTRSYPLIINVSCWETLHLESLIFQQATAATEMPKGSRKITWRRQGLEDEFPLKLADSQKILEMTVNPLFSLVLTHLPCFPLWVKQCHKPSPSHPMIIQWLSNDFPMIIQYQRLNPNKESLIKAPLRLRCSVLASVSLILGMSAEKSTNGAKMEMY